MYKECLRELGLFSLEKTQFSGELSANCQCPPSQGCNVGGGRAFAEMHRKKRGNKPKLQKGKFQLSVKKKYFTR